MILLPQKNLIRRVGFLNTVISRETFRERSNQTKTSWKLDRDNASSFQEGFLSILIDFSNKSTQIPPCRMLVQEPKSNLYVLFGETQTPDEKSVKTGLKYHSEVVFGKTGADFAEF